MNKIKIIIIDQSETFLKYVKKNLRLYPNIEIVGYAQKRDEGISLIKSLRPNVTLIDIKCIDHDDFNDSTFKDVSVLVLSKPLVGEVAKTLKAISAGATDFINKNELNKKDFETDLLFKINNAAKRNREPVQRTIAEKEKIHTKQRPVRSRPKGKRQTLVAIGTSTGGPKALQRVLEKLPKAFGAPVFVVQHMPSGFTKSLAERLNRSTDLIVKEATHNEIAENGTVYIAPGNYHMVVTETGQQLKIQLNQDDLNQGHRPSVNTLFNSIAQLHNINKAILVLTGMGRDGSEGIKTIRESSSSAMIVAESEESAVIFGMPQAAIATNCVTQVAHIDEMGSILNNYVERQG